MKNKLFKLAVTILTFGMLISVNAGTARADNGIRIDSSNGVTITSDNAKNEGITAIQLSMTVKPQAEDVTLSEVTFEFNPENNVKIAEYRYNFDSESSVLKIFMADTMPIFTDSNSLNIGTVSAKDSEGNNVAVIITVEDDALQLVSQNQIQQRNFVLKNATVPVVTESGDVEIRKNVPASYMLKIPNSTDSFKENQKFTVGASDVIVKGHQSLKISVASNNDWNLRDETGAIPYDIGYEMGYGENSSPITATSTEILRVKAGEMSGTVDLTVNSIADADIAGTYSDTLTFKVVVE